MVYIDGFVAAVPTANKDKYRAFAEHSTAIFKELGALELIEAWGDDVPDGEHTSFPMAVKCKEDETVVFSWITWPSREVRNAAHEKIRNDPRMQAMDMPFDGKRLIYGGFEILYES